MTLENLLERALESIPKDAANVDRLVAAARRSLEDAQLSGMSSEGQFDMAYKSVMQSANAVLQANGFRTLDQQAGAPSDHDPDTAVNHGLVAGTDDRTGRQSE